VAVRNPPTHGASCSETGRHPAARVPAAARRGRPALRCWGKTVKAALASRRQRRGPASRRSHPGDACRPPRNRLVKTRPSSPNVYPAGYARATACGGREDAGWIPAASTNHPRPTALRWPIPLREDAGSRGFVRALADFWDRPTTRFRAWIPSLPGRLFSPGRPAACGRSPQGAELRLLHFMELRADGSSSWMGSLVIRRTLATLVENLSLGYGIRVSGKSRRSHNGDAAAGLSPRGSGRFRVGPRAFPLGA